MNIAKVLQNFGLTEKQARVYLATLELGSSPVNTIARKAEIPRPTCYDVLESLKNQGIASSYIKKKTRYYSVEEPKKIAELAQRRANTLKEALPQLEALYGLTRERPQVRFFQGKKGMEQVFEEVLQGNKEICAFSSADDLFAALGDYYPNFVKRRAAERILARVILRDSPKARERQRLGQEELRVVKLIPPEFNYHGMMAIFGNKIALFSFVNDYIAVVIESKELAAIQRAMFEYIWQKAT
ncbi:MAG: helix-turn-helix domain-containing protein [Patescibacteria group bacterium]